MSREEINPLFAENIVANKNTVEHIRHVSCLALGAAAGILRLESLWGFAFYFVGASIVSLLIHLFVAKGQPEKYFVSPVHDVWWDQIIPGLAGLLLAWTLFYGLADA